MKWYECLECEEEFRVITESLETIGFCPLCGCETQESADDEEDEDYEE
jgi:rRNA maturation endonuclease Nob1